MSDDLTIKYPKACLNFEIKDGKAVVSGDLDLMLTLPVKLLAKR